MAINFPSTAGQPTDGSYTYTVAGLTYVWNGTSWAAAGAGQSATDLTLLSVSSNAAGTPSLTYNQNNGVFTYTPPDLSGFSGPGLNDGIGSNLNADLLDGQHGAYYTNAGNLNAGTVPTARLSGVYNIDVSGSAGSLGALTNITDVAIAVPSNGQVLQYNGANWVNATLTGTTGLQSRTTAAASQSIANGAAGNLSITTTKTYVLYSIQTSHAAWVTIYDSTTSRTNDASRSELTDPLPGSGVLAEVITTGATTQIITPGTICYNTAANDQTYMKVVNKSGATNTITVTLTYLQLEA